MDIQATYKKELVFSTIQKVQKLGFPIDPQMISSTFNLTLRDSKQLVKMYMEAK